MSKTNDPLATRRLNNRPKVSNVEVAKPVGVVSLKVAEKQGLSDGKKGVGNLSQVPGSRTRPTTTEPSN